MEKKLFFTLLLLSLTVSIFAGTDHPVFIELVNQNGQHPDDATFQAWISSRPDEVLTETSTGCTYYNFSSYQGSAVVQCGSFPTQWNVNDTLHISAITDLGNGSGDFILNMNGTQFFGDMYGEYSEGEGVILMTDPYIYVDFSANPVSGMAPLTVYFTNLTQPLQAYFFWDFDNDGEFDSTDINPIWTYTEPGVYTVKLSAQIADLFPPETEIKVDYITVGSESADDNELQVNDFNLENYPNPFNPETTISYELPKDVRNAKIEIYNIKGQKVKQLKAKSKKLGMNTVVWNGKDDNGKAVSSGVYFYRLNVNGKTEAVKKCVLMK